MPGRPSSYTQETADLICERLADGESLRAICSDASMPDKATVFRWLNSVEPFRDQYVRARDVQADSLADDILHIADTPLEGTRLKQTSDGKSETMTGDMIEHRRLQVDARKWIAAKLLPKKYGDRVMQEHVGKDGGPIETREVSSLDRAKALAALVSAAKAETDAGT